MANIRLSPDVRKFAEQMQLSLRTWNPDVKMLDEDALVVSLDSAYDTYVSSDEGDPKGLELAADVSIFLMLICKREGLLND